MQVKNFYYPDDAEYDTQAAQRVINLSVREKGCKSHNPSQGDKIKGGYDSFLEFVQADKDYSSDNEDSLAVYIKYGDFSALTCGDNEKGSEEQIKKYNVDILQLPHHGSKYATSSKFISRFDPEYVVVSTDGKKYGHPNKETFEICNEYDSKIKVFRTDMSGDIEVTATKKSWKFIGKGININKCIVVDKALKNDDLDTDKIEQVNQNENVSDKMVGKVFTTRTGRKYHSRKSCPGLSNAKQIYEVDIENVNNLEKCKICW